MKGKVILVGAGPGDPGLLTVRGQRLLARADVVVTDALVNPRLWQGLRARIIDVGKRGPGAPHGAHQRLSQHAINRLLVRLARQGQQVVRLKGGDPFVFGRGSEELETLRQAKIPFEIVPGVSSAYAVPAYAGIPITDRRFASHVTILTGHEKDEKKSKLNIDWDRLSPNGTLVIFMGVSRWPAIQNELLKRKWPASHPVAAIESGTTPRQRVIVSRLSRAADDFQRHKLHAPAIVVVGGVAKLGRTLAWLRENRPLLGRRAVVMRPADQAADLIQALEDQGADVVFAPVLRIQSLAKHQLTQRRVQQWQRAKTSFDFLIFLSVNAVRCFEEVASALTAQWRHAAVAAVGEQTARAARDLGWRVSVMPRTYNAKALVPLLGVLAGKRCLIPRVESAPDNILVDLRRRRAEVSVLPIYRSQTVALSSAVKRAVKAGADIFIFTSTSMVDAFVKNFSAAERRRLFRKARIVSIGSKTTAALRKQGVRSIRQARNSTVEALVAAAL